MSIMIMVSNISKSTPRIFSLLILIVTIASAFDFDELMHDDNDLQEIWKRSNAELINGLIGMDLGKLTKAGKRSIIPPSMITNKQKAINNGQRFNMNLKKLLSYQRHC
ncbi:hypothetical protein LOAG_07167 [Loa loa]|uniref:Pigment dispersing factor n=1 Tax=Loa loa TaxID=7209 RepID=A0A1I7W0J2_LOALO|nr:hypothetical protein LOAG_07167 [Loa loa]EFO21320.2 hypothetical protein LOAG_07167 [Loa loa]